MAVVALTSIKGGTGKSMLALNLTERAAAAGLSPVLVDCDPQRSSFDVCGLRDEVPWGLVNVEVDLEGSRTVSKLATSGEHGLVVCDLPGRDDYALGLVLSRVDLVLSPSGSGVQDLFGAANFGSIALEMSWPAWFVVNGVTPGRRRTEVLVSELESFGLPVCPVRLQQRVVHKDAARLGLGVCELSPSSPAAGEMDALWRWTAGRLVLPPGPELNKANG